MDDNGPAAKSGGCPDRSNGGRLAQAPRSVGDRVARAQVVLRAVFPLVTCALDVFTIGLHKLPNILAHRGGVGPLFSEVHREVIFAGAQVTDRRVESITVHSRRPDIVGGFNNLDGVAVWLEGAQIQRQRCRSDADASE